MEGSSVTELEQPQKPINTKERINTPNSLQSQLVSDGIVKLNPSYNPKDLDSKRYTVNLEAAKKLLQSPQAKKEPSPVIFGKEQITTEGEKSFKKVVKAFVTHGDITPQLAVQIGRVVRPSDILTHNEDFARFLFFGDNFPASAAERADLEIGTEYINGWALEDMQKATTDAGLNLTNEQLFQLALRNGIAHEYGHAIEWVVGFLRGQGIGEGRDTWRERENLKEEMRRSVYDNIAPRPKLQQLLEGQPTEGYAVERSRTTSERIAVGFESLGTRYALEEIGLDSQTIQKVLDNLDKADINRFNEAVKLIQLLSDNGLSIQDLADARLDISSYLNSQGEMELYKPLQWGLDTRLLGYYYPLTKDELQKFISQWMPQT